MLAVNLAQRIVGLLRNLGFCQLLSDAELGQWAMASSFFVIAAPIAVLGLPGSFGKFVEYYRSRGQLANYLRHLSTVSAIGVAVSTATMLLWPEFFSWLIFRESKVYYVIAWTVTALVAVVIFNTINELAVSLRQVRIVSIMQFVNSVSFAVFGAAGLIYTRQWTVLLPCYAAACAAGSLPGLWVLATRYRDDLRLDGGLPNRSMWSRIIPFAIAMWCMNLLSNLYEVCDRAMLLHLCHGTTEFGQALVGQYHCGRILPNLLLSLAMLLGGVLLPYLSADWEHGNRARVRERLRAVTLLVSFGFTAFSVAALLASPLLFDWVFEGRYAEAQVIMPLALTQCVWAGLTIVVQSYLLCAERGKQVTAILAAGLMINCFLNWPLIQLWGLTGAVIATTIANLIVFALTFAWVGKAGCPLGWSTFAVCLIPAAIAAGPIAAAIALAAIAPVACRTNWLLRDVDRREIDQCLVPILGRLGLRLSTLW